MKLRPRTDADVPVVVAIILAQRADSGYPVSLPPEGPEAFVARADELGAWVAEDEGEVVGHILVQRCPEPVSEGSQEEIAAYTTAYGCRPAELGDLGCLVVAAAARGKGVGSALMKHATQACRDAGLRPCLNVVHSHRDAHRLYLGLGWQTVAEINPPWMPDGEGPAYAMILPPSPGALRNQPAQQPVG